MADVIRACQDIADVVDELDARGPMPPAERVAAWHHAQVARDRLDVVLTQMNADAVNAMRELGIEEGSTDVGLVHIAAPKTPEHWNGYGLLGELAQPLIDRATGERVQAVPLVVLRATIAGCSDPTKTYSRWLVGGLKEHLPRRYSRFRDFGETPPERMKPGPRPRR